MLITSMSSTEQFILPFRNKSVSDELLVQSLYCSLKIRLIHMSYGVCCMAQWLVCVGFLTYDLRAIRLHQLPKVNLLIVLLLLSNSPQIASSPKKPTKEEEKSIRIRIKVRNEQKLKSLSNFVSSKSHFFRLIF